MTGAHFSWVVTFEGANLNVNIFVSTRPILNIVVSVDCY